MFSVYMVPKKGAHMFISFYNLAGERIIFWGFLTVHGTHGSVYRRSIHYNRIAIHPLPTLFCRGLVETVRPKVDWLPALLYVPVIYALSNCCEWQSYDRRACSVEKDNKKPGAALVDSDAEPFPHLDSIR